MARVNVHATNPLRTHEGAMAHPMSDEQALRRSVLSCLLWEDNFYEDGQEIATRIRTLAEKIDPSIVADLAIEARTMMNLRHAPLLLLDVLSRTGAGRKDRLVARTIEQVIIRGDEPAEFLALYTKGGDRRLAPLHNGRQFSAQVMLGIELALRWFDAYQFAKYDRNAKVKLRDVFRIVRPKPFGEKQAMLFKAAKEGTLASPDTWEVALSGGADKRETFERLLREDKLGYLALLRNLRKMAEVHVDPDLINEKLILRKGAARVLPFRYVAAARAAPQFESAIDKALLAAIDDMRPLKGKTAVLVDVSGSMDYNKLSAKSDLTRLDAGAALAAIIKSDMLRMFAFSNEMVEVPARRGMAGVDVIRNALPHGGTYLGQAVGVLNKLDPYERLIVITDEQSHDQVPDPVAPHAYMINVAAHKNGVGYGRWTHIDGFSENVIRFIREFEAA